MRRLVTSLFTLLFILNCHQLLAGLPFSDGSQPLPSLAPMLKRTTPAVVNIATTGARTVQNPLAQDPFFRRFFDIPQQTQRRTQSLGSGVIVDANEGLILTNQHVIKHARQITVTLTDGRETKATLIGADAKADLAVIKIDTPNLTAVEWFDSEALEVGDFVVAIGNPFGLGQTVTSGIVSAIPANMARQMMAQLVEHGEVRRGRLGIAVQNLTPELADALDVKTRRGAVISRVYPGSPAQAAGLEPGDVVLALDGRKVREAKTLINLIGLKPVGTRVRLTIARGGKTVEQDVDIQ